ncbi:hypothetical protein [Gemmatimonas sp.]|uniref:hypothetical protein n=1 Tax=Gemmatimonas sp. TaxID=1962908 RepID=UPI003983585E
MHITSQFRSLCAGGVVGVATHVATLTLLVASTGSAQATPSIATSYVATLNLDTTRAISARSPITFSLDHPLADGDGTLALIVGTTDVTALAVRSAAGITYQPTLQPLPAGNTSIALYRVVQSQWIEVRRVVLHVLTASGFSRVSATPAVTVGNKGQLAAGRSSGIPAPARPTFQDAVLNGALQTSHERGRVVLETSTSYIGSSRREEALRFGQLQQRAPRIDLADVRVALRAGGTTLTLGQTSFGTSRHLANGFGSRGASLAVARGATQLSIGALSASPIVGWDHPLGVTRSNHRVLGMSLGRELVATRPGAAKLELTLLDASSLPLNGFQQGAILDAERSAGGAAQLNLQSPGQRARLSAGIARSRFNNAAFDEQLIGNATIKASQAETRSAQFVESNLSVLQNRTVRGLGVIALSVAARHERVDPLYRSIAASLQADRQQDGADVTFTLGALSGQVAASQSRDNVGRILTILSTRDRSTSGNLALPVATLVRMRRYRALWPILTLSVNRAAQQAASIPVGDTFRPQDIPDQVNTLSDASAQWQLATWRVSVRRNRSHQDNRQISRELSDFSAGSDVVSVSGFFGTQADVSLDLGHDRQRSEERREQSTTNRATLNANLRRGRQTSVALALSLLRTTPPTGPTTLNSEQRAELTQPLAFWRDASGGARGQLFVRYARTTARIPDFLRAALDPLALLSQQQWSIASGLNLRVF